MAASPCDVDGLLYRGRAHHLYVAILVSPNVLRKRVRVCEIHMVNLLSSPLSQWRYVNPEDLLYPTIDFCVLCNEKVTEVPVICFVTAYPANEREDYVGAAHHACAAAIGDESLVAALWHLEGSPEPSKVNQ